MRAGRDVEEPHGGWMMPSTVDARGAGEVEASTQNFLFFCSFVVVFFFFPL